MRRFLLLLAFFATACASTTERRVTLFHFSDYHSHAVPFYAGGQRNAAGIARALALLEPESRRHDVLIFNGGDTMNAGAPSWSDKHRCVEWSWWNGIVDAMAFGNHDADYGPDEFARCRSSVAYPILSSNIVDTSGEPLLISEGKPYAIFERNGVRIGVIAAAGADFERLMPPARRPFPDTRFADRATVVRDAVIALREKEKASIVVVIGHAQTEEDEGLARAVPGIDVIFGTHAHLERGFSRIEGTNTFMISPSQYLTYISRVDLVVSGDRLQRTEGRLIRMNAELPEDKGTQEKVAALQRELETDPEYAARFQPIGQAAEEISIDGQNERDSPMGNFVLDVIRNVTNADIAVATASSFREPLAPGVIRGEDLRAALPYDNEILLYDLTGAQVRRLIEVSWSRQGSDLFSQISGLRIARSGTIDLLKDSDHAPLADDGRYSVALPAYQARVADGYREIFSGLPSITASLRMREAVERAVREGGVVTAKRDGRIVD